LIVVHQLVQTDETLWLRLLGREGKQKMAIAEFAQAPTENDLYASIEELLVSYRASLESRRELPQEDEELIMQLSEAYLKKRQEWFEEGKEEGKEEGEQRGRQAERQSNAVSMLREGIAVESIARITGFSIAEIEQLRQKHSS
jgi:predicted transposase/invertase (TIGR01784 family)